MNNFIFLDDVVISAKLNDSVFQYFLQMRPCVFHVVPLGTPHPPTKCEVRTVFVFS